MALNNNNDLPDDTDANAQTILSVLPVGALRRETLLTMLVFLAAAGLDAAVNWKTVGSTFGLSELNTETGETVVAVGFSFLTVLVWVFCGGVWAAGFRRAAGGVYLLALATIGYLIAPLASSMALERWVGLGFEPTLSFWQQAIGIVLLTMLVSLPGLLLCACEQRLISLWAKWSIRAELLELLRFRTDAGAVVKLRDTVAQDLQDRKRTKEADIAVVVEQIEQELNGIRARLAANAAADKNNPRLNKAARKSACDRERAMGLVKGVGAVLVVLATLAGSPARANPVDDLLQKSPTLLLLLDNTGGSPALEPAMLPHIERRAVEKLERLSIGASVIVFSVGDPRQIPEIKRWRVQSRITANGGTVTYLKHALHKHLEGFPARQHPDKHKESHLVQGWHDAAQLLNPKAETENAVLFVTDAMEFSSLANCYKACKLPKPTFQLNNTSIEMLGIGFGQSSRTTLAIFEEWKRYFAAAGVPNTQLLHVF